MKLKISFKIKSDLILKIIYPFLAFLIISGLILLVMFLYNNFYRAITQAGQLPDLRAQIAPDLVNVSLFEKVINKIDEKITKPDIVISTINNPFTIASPDSNEQPGLE